MKELELTQQEVDAAYGVLRTWGGLRDRHLDSEAIVRRMLLAAAKAKAKQEKEG